MPGGGSKPGERRGGRKRGTPNKTLTEQAQALAAKMAKAEARANAKLVALAHAIQATVAESQGLPGASARERRARCQWRLPFVAPGAALRRTVSLAPDTSAPFRSSTYAR